MLNPSLLEWRVDQHVFDTTFPVGAMNKKFLSAQLSFYFDAEAIVPSMWGFPALPFPNNNCEWLKPFPPSVTDSPMLNVKTLMIKSWAIYYRWLRAFSLTDCLIIALVNSSARLCLFLHHAWLAVPCAFDKIDWDHDLCPSDGCLDFCNSRATC